MIYLPKRSRMKLGIDIKKGKENSENPKTITFEYGDALISRDVVCDEFQVNTKDSHKEKNIQFEKSDLCKKENVSVSSELPVAKSKWGIKLRHVITRDLSIDDNLHKVDVEKNIYNFRKLSKHSRPNSVPSVPNSVHEESSRKSENVSQLWRSKSNDLVFNSTGKERECNKHEFPSVLQRLKSFEMNSRKIELDVEKKEVRTTTKPLSLEDLLNLDEKNRNVDVIDKFDTAFKKNDLEVRRNPVIRSPKVDSIPLKNANKSSSTKHLVDNVVKESITSNRLPHNVISNSQKTESNIHATSFEMNESHLKKQNTFSKIKSNNHKKPISLQELLMLDEQNLSIDVIDKSDNVKKEKCIYDHDKYRDTKSDKFTSVDLSEKEIEVLTDVVEVKEEILNSSNLKKVVSETMVQSIHSKDSEPAIDHPKQGGKLKGNVTNVADIELKNKLEELKSKFTRIDKPHGVDNELGQIILSTDSPFEEGLVELKKTRTNQSSIHNVDNVSHTKTNGTKLVNHIVPDKRIVDHEKINNTLKDISPSKVTPQKVDHIKTDNVGNLKKIDQPKSQLDVYNYEEKMNTHNLKNSNGKNDVDSDLLVILKEQDNGIMKKEKLNNVKSEKCVDNRISINESRQTNGVKVDTNLKNVDECCQPIVNKQIGLADNESDLLNSTLISRNGQIKKSVEPAKTSLVPSSEDEKTFHDTPEKGEIEENISRPPINRKVGKLIIMTGDQRNDQLKNKAKISILNDESHTNHRSMGMVDDNKIEELKKQHKEGFSLTFMSNELEDDGIPDDYLVPKIVLNGSVVGLKSMIPKQKNSKIKKAVLFNNAKLTTIHTYPSNETCIKDEDCSEDFEFKSYETNLKNQYPSMKTYEPSYSFDFGSVIQRERQRFHSLDEENHKASPKLEVTFDHLAEDNHFNSHHNQDAGHALLF